MKLFSILPIFMLVTICASAQTAKTETFSVSGNCGMCKTKIEKAAKEAGATFASWDVEAKKLTIKYNSSTTNAAKIQQKIANVGYDNAGFKAADDVYNKLHGCCKYERTSASTEKECCGEKCEMKDGKCTDMSVCKDKKCCTADGKCKAGAECKHDGAHAADASCCKGS